MGLPIADQGRGLSSATPATGYHAEVAAALVPAAQRLIIVSSLPVTEAALEVGCATPQQFSALFPA